MPLPPGLVVKNGTNRLSGFATPGPLSSISNTTLSLPRSARSSTGRIAGGVASTALRTRLIRACWSWSASPRRRGRRRTRTARGRPAARRRPAAAGRDIAVRDRRLRHAREFAVARQEPPERLGAIRDQREVVDELLAFRLVRRSGRKGVPARLDHGLDRRERVVEFMPDHADQPAPGTTLFFAQRLAEIRHDQEAELAGRPRGRSRA